MQCPTPSTVPRPNGRGSADRISVPCGKCIICLQNRRKHWSFRLEQEYKTCQSAYFITLTYDDANLPFKYGDKPECMNIAEWTVHGGYKDSKFNRPTPSLKKRDLFLFLKALRQFNTRDREKYESIAKLPKNSLKKAEFKYYACGEYGSNTKRPHYHIILFNLNSWYTTDFVTSKILEIWKHGQVHIGGVSPASITYVAKYLINSYEENICNEKPFSVMSKGIGLSYIDKTRGWFEETGNNFILDQGIKKSIPRYFRKKLNMNTEAQSTSNTKDYIVNGKDILPDVINKYKKQKPKKSTL